MIPYRSDPSKSLRNFRHQSARRDGFVAAPIAARLRFA